MLQYYETKDCAHKLSDIFIQAETRAVPFASAGAPGDSVKHVRERPFGFVLDVEGKSGGKQRELLYFDAENKHNLEAWVAAVEAAASALRVAPTLSQGSHPAVADECQRLRVSWCSDVEGHWEYFCNFVELSQSLRFTIPGDHRGARSGMDIELEDGWHFVYGGDCCDKGPGTMRFLETLVRFKKRYPERVHILLGNRDVMRLRLPAELAASEIDRLAEVPRAPWATRGSEVTALDHVRNVAAKHEGIPVTAVTKEMIREHNTRANRLRYMFKYNMGADGEFEFRRAELHHLRGKTTAEGIRGDSEVNDEEVLRSYDAELAEGGNMREYFRLAQLAVLLCDTLFVHGSLINDPTGKEAGQWCVGVLPDEEMKPTKTASLKAWVDGMNEWGRNQIRQWELQPMWKTPPKNNTPLDWRGRGGADLILYGTPACTIPTVLYGRWLTSTCMPRPYPKDLVDYLKSEGVHRVIVGHTPHGSCPTVVPHDGLTLIMGDTSFSHLKSDLHYAGDNRGDAVSEVVVEGHAVHVRGRTQMDDAIDYVIDGPDADPFAGLMQAESVPRELRHFVKARVFDKALTCSYLFTRVEGFTVHYMKVPPERASAVLSGELTVEHAAEERMQITGHGDVFGCHCDYEQDLRNLLEYVFRSADLNEDGIITPKELLLTCANEGVRQALGIAFPGLDVDAIVTKLDQDGSKTISMDEIHAYWEKVCRGSQSRQEGQK